MVDEIVSTSDQHEKLAAEPAGFHLESVHLDDVLPNKDLRIDGDDADHDHKTPVCSRQT